MRDRILKFIEKYKKQYGFAPSQAQIATSLNVHRQSINYYFKDLEPQLKTYPEYGRYFK